MSAVRAVPVVLLVTGLALGTASDAVPRRSPPTAHGHWILAADFHVHAFPGDGALAPWALRREAEHAGLDVYAITNHNQVFTARWGRRLAGDSDGPIVIGGSEITNPAFHLIAVGIERPVAWDQSAAEAIEAVHAQKGVAIAAHPARRFWDGWDARAVALLDGVEAAHPQGQFVPEAADDFAAFHARARKAKPDIAPIGSSDFHVGLALAHSRTYVFAGERTQAGVLDAIRHGRTVAEDGNRRLYGDPELVRLVEANRPRGRSDEHAAWRRAAVTFAWMGLLGMLGLRGGTRR